MYASLGETVLKTPSSQAMVFCMGGNRTKFYYIRIKPFPTEQLDTTNLFKFIREKNKYKFFHAELEHGDFGTPRYKLPIKIVDTSIIGIDSILFGKHVSNCPTIYFSLKKKGKTGMIVKMRRSPKDTIFLFNNEEGLTAEKKSIISSNSKTKWLGVITIKN
jgi:hypothetical protein